jgi:hypothetical protein
VTLSRRRHSERRRLSVVDAAQNVVWRVSSNIVR